MFYAKRPLELHYNSKKRDELFVSFKFIKFHPSSSNIMLRLKNIEIIVWKWPIGQSLNRIYEVAHSGKLHADMQIFVRHDARRKISSYRTFASILHLPCDFGHFEKFFEINRKSNCWSIYSQMFYAIKVLCTQYQNHIYGKQWWLTFCKKK